MHGPTSVICPRSRLRVQVEFPKQSGKASRFPLAVHKGAYSLSSNGQDLNAKLDYPLHSAGPERFVIGAIGWP
jgi:hypothetical protein